MIRKILKLLFLIVGIVSILFIIKDIQHPFWQDNSYRQTIINFQKDQDIFPYRARLLYWNNLVIIKSLLERVTDILWSGIYFYIPIIYILFLIKKRKWSSLFLVFIFLLSISIENNPNTSKYLPYLTPLIIASLI